MTRNILLRLELLVFLAMVSGGCQVVEGIFKAGMWVGILLVVVVLGSSSCCSVYPEPLSRVARGGPTSP